VLTLPPEQLKWYGWEPFRVWDRVEWCGHRVEGVPVPTEDGRWRLIPIVEWADVNIPEQEIRVARAISHGRLGTPKSGHGRLVDMSNQAAQALQRLLVDQKKATLANGWPEVPRSVFCTDEGLPTTEECIRGAFTRALAGAKLPAHHTPHSLRHTYASLMLQMGESPAYVQRQLGHASIQLTVDTYGKWLPAGNKAAANRLDNRPGGSKTVAATIQAGGGSAQVPDIFEKACAGNINRYNGRA
jgi:hypothetical protein